MRPVHHNPTLNARTGTYHPWPDHMTCGAYYRIPMRSTVRPEGVTCKKCRKAMA